MVKITKLTKEKIYRDSKSYYLEINQETFSDKLIDFCQQHAGKRILDFGCATGNYCLQLRRFGFEYIGVDINKEYIKIAQSKDVEAYLIKDKLPFSDKSFDTVVMFELLEHVHNPDKILKEAERVAKKNILITVPDCGGFETLKNYQLIYEHFLELDHVSFFTKKELEGLLAKHFKKFRVERREPILLGKFGLPWWLRKPISLLYKLNLIRPEVYYRLYAIIDLEGD